MQGSRIVLDLADMHQETNTNTLHISILLFHNK
jgi:hypothetical protein